MANEVFQVHGECHVRVGTGAAGALEDLGISVDGVRVQIEDHVDPIMTDGTGPRVPRDEQSFLQTANITIQLVYFVPATLTKLRALHPDLVEGVMPKSGVLYGQDNKYFRLLLNNELEPYNFLKARTTGIKETTLSVVKSVWNLSFFSIPYKATVGSTAGTVLYNRITA